MIKYLLLLFISTAIYAANIPDPFPVDSVKSAVMPNGLKVIIKENHGAPIVAVSVIIRAGSGVNDSKGIPHYIEHMAFQGSQKYPSPLSAQYLIEEKGGYCTGTTTRDSTRFEGVIAADKTELMISVLSQVTLFPILSNNSFERERPTILAEIQRYNDDRTIDILNTAYYLSYKNHPYRYPTTGTIRDILLLKPDDIREFHKRWYLPGNMSIVVVGDVKTNDILNYAEKYFTVTGKPFTAIPEHKVQKQDCGQFISALPADTEIRQAFSWPVSAADDMPGCAAADILTSLLTTGNNALIYRWLQDAKIPVISTGGEYITTRNDGRIIIWIHTLKKDADTARKIILLNMNKISQFISNDLLNKTKTRVKAEFLMNNETFAQQAATLAIYQSLDTGEYTINDYIELIDKTTIQEIIELGSVSPTAIVVKGSIK